MHSYRRFIVAFMPRLDDFASARLSCIVYRQIREVYVGIEIRLRLVLLLVIMIMIIMSTIFIMTGMHSVIVRHNNEVELFQTEQSLDNLVLCLNLYVPACDQGSTVILYLYNPITRNSYVLNTYLAWTGIHLTKFSSSYTLIRKEYK